MSGSLKLVNLIESHAEAIAAQWARDVRKNPRTPSYHHFLEEQIIPIAVRFYDNFRRMFYSEKPAETSQDYFARYAEDAYRKNIPLNEALYALIMMRRHIWLYAEFQTIFISAVEQKQAVDSLVRTILMFDYAILFISQRYQELYRAEIDRVIGPVNVLRLESKTITAVGGFKAAVMAVLLAGAAALTYYYHNTMGTTIIFTHLFYIPIVLAGIWWKRRGILVAMGLGVYLVASHLLFLKEVPLVDDLIRALMFVVIGAVVGFLSEGIYRAEGLYRT